MWSAGEYLRTRRHAFNLSLDDLASRIGVTRSYLSLVETGKRAPTSDQLNQLAAELLVPVEMLMVGSGRLPDDVRTIVRQDTAGVAAAVRQRAEQLAIVYPTAPEIAPPSRTAVLGGLGRASLSEHIVVAKTSASYRAHSYHTKVPPDAITPLIEAFTRPGDIVLDPFCGSGMTGVAALMTGRNALLSDLSPAAIHIARNYTQPCDPGRFRAALARVAAAVEPTMTWLYTPLDGDRRTVEYMMWSDVFRCPSCRDPIVYWDAQTAGKIEGPAVTCPSCARRSRKADLDWLCEQAVMSHTSSTGRRIDAHAPTRGELALIDDTEAAPIPYWVPDVPFGRDREMWRASHSAMGITSAADFFTKRNLHALAALRHAIVSEVAGREREALMFAFTACVNRASRRYQWNAKRPTNVMTGTLYISSLRYEWNVWSLFKRKAADVQRYFERFPETSATAQVFQRSATDLSCLADQSVDMVFMDPPFGSNIFYADSSLLWDAWLGTLTDTSAEIVVNKQRTRIGGGKTLTDYGELMGGAFSEASRVLRRGGKAVLAFSNTNDQVWLAIQQALGTAGFDVASAHMLDKGQPSIKGVKGVLGEEQVTTLDLVLCLQHSTRSAQFAVAFPPPPAFIDETIRLALAKGGGRADLIYSAVVRAILAANYSLSGITIPAVVERLAELGTRDAAGNWRGNESPGEGEDFIAGYLASPDALPVTTGGDTPAEPPAERMVSGGRGSPFYLAHSYHTKVPPESITPFITHFTKPGDVVLDPFCGSGMTGVAAALAGRRAILNDLSTAAVHLAWNHTRPCDPHELATAFERLEAQVAPRLADLYQTESAEGLPGTIHWTMWSTRHRCPSCHQEFALWDVVDRATGRVGRTINCPACSSELARKSLPSLGSVPAWISYELADGSRHEKATDESDIARAGAVSRAMLETWFPATTLGPDREMYLRCALHLQNVASVADLYTPRNLLALSLIWREILALPEGRVRRALAFAFTNTAWHGTRMRRFNARGGQRPLTGTLYIPQLSSEANVLEVMRNKIGQLKSYFRAFKPTAELPAIQLGSATRLASIADGSIDYVFTDPPFGSNIFYADCNLVWESWLGRLTEPTEEAVVNRSLTAAKGGKTLGDYEDLIAGAMCEIARVLKPGGWATVVFHNTDAAVWKAIRDAAHHAGFEFHEAASLDRKQQSHKGYKGRQGEEDVAHFDVVMNLRKPLAARSTREAAVFDLATLVRDVLKDDGVAARGAQGVHAEVMRRLMSIGSEAFPDFADVRRTLATLT